MTEITDSTTLDDAVPRQSNFLTKEDVTPYVLVTVSHLAMGDIETDGKTEHRAILHFHGDLKPMVLNQTNKELLKAATGEVTAGGIKNKKIVLFNDATIMFQGRMTGGIRIRAARNQPEPTSDDYGDVPF